MTKTQKVFSEMLSENSELFDKFKRVHEAFAKDKEVNREEFNSVGSKALRVIRRYENILCGKSENSGYGRFSSSLSDKFWEEVRAMFPLIDSVRPE